MPIFLNGIDIYSQSLSHCSNEVKKKGETQTKSININTDEKYFLINNIS